MKLAPLLAQYLYSTKSLDLPGIGSFKLDASALPDPETLKQSKPVIIDGISFQNDPAIREAGDLVGYISSQTGKMKALAAADLCSHLELVQQFLNIGKPFLLEGIGSLVKIKSGQFEFTSGSIQAEKLRDLTVKEATVTSAKEESFSSSDPQRSSSISWRKPVMALLIVLGAGLAVWGGYTVYKSNSSAKNPVSASSHEPSMLLAAAVDTTPVVKEIDPIVNVTTPAGNKKFVLEIAGRTRAFERLNRLKAYYWNVQMETTDSVQFKLFMVLPANESNVTKITDSLTALNGRKVYVEQ